MIGYKNEKAILLIQEAQRLEDFVASKEPQLERDNLSFSDADLDMLARAARLRNQADEIEFNKECSLKLKDA